MTHIDEELLAEYILSLEDGRDFPDVAAHLRGCEECRTRSRALSAFFETLTDRGTWQAVQDFADASEEERAILAFAARSKEEYAEAHAALSPVLKDPVAFVRERVERQEQYRTGGAVRVLAETANGMCERNPIHARNLAEAAIAIAGQLPEAAYRGDSVRLLRMLAWKERANAMRFLGEYPAALDALDHAEREIAHLGKHAYELASLAYIRASVLMYTDRLTEATQKAAESAEIFAAYGDVQWWARARSVEAGVLFYRSEFADAARAFEQLVAYAIDRGDEVEAARQSYNLATCHLELGDATQAGPLLLDARRLFVQCGMQTWVLRADWKIGVLSRVVGRFDESIAQFRFTRKTAEEFSLPAEAAHITLDLVESLLIVERLREVPALCGEVSRYFRRAGKLRQALTAAAFLREAATDGTIRVATVQHVRKFVRELERRPQLVFVPPPD
jgi:tetratricopeptide (TPR) repeat protein